MRHRLIKCRCGFIVASWGWTEKSVSPEFNGDRLFENMMKHKSRLRGHGLIIVETEI